MGCGRSRVVTIEDTKKLVGDQIDINKANHMEKNKLINVDPKNKHGFAINNQMFVAENKHSISHCYKFLEKLGEGSCSKVFKVMHLVTKELRAIKIIKKDFAKYKDDDKKTVQEIHILSMLDHPNIVKVYEYFTDDKFYYVVVELVQGGEIYEQLYSIRNFNERDASKIMEQIFSAVFYLHSKGIVHMDLKPENMILDAQNRKDLTIKLIDFGIANFYTKTKLTSKIGSSYFTAPEVINSNYDEKCDLWSCGVIMYILLSGNYPFEGKDEKEVVTSILRGKFSFSNSEWKGISEEAKDLIRLLLKYKSVERISAGEALKHPWIARHKSAEKIDLPKLSVDNFLLNISYKHKLQKMTIAYLVHQMSTNENLKMLRDIFMQMDSSGDGRLSLEDIKQGYSQFFGHSLSDHECEEILKEVDQDKSGYIEFEEFLRVTLKVETIITEKNLKIAFSFFDKNNSGRLSAEEIKVILGDKNPVDNEYIKSIIEEVDTNHDGLITFEEFKDLMKNIIS